LAAAVLVGADCRAAATELLYIAAAAACTRLSLLALCGGARGCALGSSIVYDLAAVGVLQVSHRSSEDLAVETTSRSPPLL
jgi:hypothetical protein